VGLHLRLKALQVAHWRQLNLAAAAAASKQMLSSLPLQPLAAHVSLHALLLPSICLQQML
jgi:hypothetical protein